MKKAIAVLMLLVMTLGLCACDGKKADDGMVTVYVPAKLIIQGPDGVEVGSTEVVYEDGWEYKTCFHATYEMGESYTLTYEKGLQTIVYGPESNLEKVEVRYDDQGRQVSQVIYFRDGYTTKSENKFVYDEKGRQLETVVRQETEASDEVIEVTTRFAIEETTEGAVATGHDGGVTIVMTYDKDNRLVKTVNTAVGTEMSRTEIQYDDHGCQSKICTYADGKLMTASITQCKAVKVSPETAKILSQFVRK